MPLWSARVLELVGGNLAFLGDPGLELGPQVAEQLARLFAVLGAHLLEDERLDVGLVLAHARDLHANAVFVQRALL